MQVDLIYSIQKFFVQNENVYYPSGSGNKLQIQLTNNFVFQRIDDNNIIPPIVFHFKPIEIIKSSKIKQRVGRVISNI